jgi:hypothetical protein
MSKMNRTALAAALSLVGLAAFGSQSKAAVIHEYMNISDIHAPIGGIAGLNASGNIVGLGGVDDFYITDGSVLPFVFPNSHFEVTGGFAVATAVVTDTNGNNVADPGESVDALIGPGTFDIVNGAGVVLHGTFGGATLNTAIGSSAVTINTSSAIGGGLSLSAGPVMVSNLGSLAFQPDESFALNIVGIAPGVQVGTPTVVAPGYLTASLLPFAVNQSPSSSGSIDLRAELVPEPASFGLIGLGVAAAMGARRRKA